MLERALMQAILDGKTVEARLQWGDNREWKKVGFHGLCHEIAYNQFSNIDWRVKE